MNKHGPTTDQLEAYRKAHADPMDMSKLATASSRLRPYNAVIEINLDNDKIVFRVVNNRDGCADTHLTREQAIADIELGAKVRLFHRTNGKPLWSLPVAIDLEPNE